jgi:hypothetical protein
MVISVTTRSGLRRSASDMSEAPSLAVPTTSKWGRRKAISASRNSRWSSARSKRGRIKGRLRPKTIMPPCSARQRAQCKIKPGLDVRGAGRDITTGEIPSPSTCDYRDFYRPLCAARARTDGSESTEISPCLRANNINSALLLRLKASPGTTGSKSVSRSG